MKKLATESIAPADHRDLARARLRELAAKAKIGDVVSPAIDNFKESQSTLHRRGEPGK